MQVGCVSWVAGWGHLLRPCSTQHISSLTRIDAGCGAATGPLCCCARCRRHSRAQQGTAPTSLGVARRHCLRREEGGVTKEGLQAGHLPLQPSLICLLQQLQGGQQVVAGQQEGDGLRGGSGCSVYSAGAVAAVGCGAWRRWRQPTCSRTTHPTRSHLLSGRRHTVALFPMALHAAPDTRWRYSSR
jgi:hypothetical protein